MVRRERAVQRLPRLVRRRWRMARGRQLLFVVHRPVHGVGGILGTLLTGVFASNALGIFSGQEDIVIADQLGIQAIGVIAVVGYTAIVTFIILLVTNALVGNRVSDDEEIEGLDLVLHNERGYDI